MPRVIITVPEKNAQPYRFQLDRRVVSLGRGSDNDIVIDSGSVSGKHAEMNRVEGGYELVDLGSTNGIKRNNERMHTIPLFSGMSVKLGDVAFDFSLTEEELDALAKETPLSSAPIEKEREIERPAAERRDSDAKPRKQIYAPAPQPAGGGFGMILLFLVLAGAAFFTGLSIRHQKDTGEPLWKAMAKKSDVQQQEPAVNTPADSE